MMNCMHDGKCIVVLLMPQCTDSFRTDVFSNHLAKDTENFGVEAIVSCVNSTLDHCFVNDFQI